MDQREVLAYQLYEIVDLDGKNVTIDNFISFVHNCHPDTEYMDGFSLDCLMDVEDNLWNLGHLESIFLKKNELTSLKVSKLMRNLYLNTDDTEFRCSMLTILCQLIRSSILNKLNVYSESFMDNLIHLLDSTTDQWLSQVLTSLILEFADLGITSSQLLLLYKHCYNQGRYSDLFYNIFEQFDRFTKSLIFHSNKQKLLFEKITLCDYKTGFITSCWIRLTNSVNKAKLNSSIHSFTFLTLNKYDGSLLINYIIENNKIRVVTPTEEQLFVSFHFDINKAYNISFAHVCEGKKKLRIDMYVDGVLIESKIIDSLFNYSTGSSRSIFSYAHVNSNAEKTFDLVISGPGSLDNVILEFGSIYIIETPHYIEWILFIHLLGPDYSGFFADSNLMSLIRFNDFFELYSKLNESVKFFENISFPQLNLKKSDVILVWNSIDNLFDDGFFKYIYRSEEKIMKISNYENFLIRNGISLLDVFNSIGGLFYCLQLVEKSDTDTLLLKNITFLLTILEKHRIIETSFVRNSGYEILAALLKSKKKIISIDILDCVLKYVGYDVYSPVNSIIKNKMAYKSLILDFGLWQCSSNPLNKITNKFLLFQFCVFGHDSKYFRFNIQQLNDMKVIKRILLALKRNVFSEEILQVVNNILWILIRSNYSPDVVKLLLLHVIFSVNKVHDDEMKKNIQQMGGETILEIIKSLIDEQPKLLNTFSFKFSLSVLKGSSSMKKIGLNLLIRSLHSSSKTYDAFLSFCGFSIMTNFLKTEWDDNDILVQLLMAVFGECYKNPEKKTIDKIVQKISGNIATVVKCPHFFAVLNNLMKFAALRLDPSLINEAFDRLDQYIKMLFILKDTPEFAKTFLENSDWMGNFIFLAMLVKQNGSSNLYDSYSQFLTENLLDGIYTDTAGDSYLAIIEHTYVDYSVEFNIVIIPCLFEKLKYHQNLQTFLLSNISKAISICRIFICYFQTYNKIKLDHIQFLENFEISALVIKTLTNASKSQSKITPFLRTLSREFNDSFIVSCIYYIENTVNLDISLIKERLVVCCQIFMSSPDIIVHLSNDTNLLLLFTIFKVMCTDIGLVSLSINCIRILLLEKPKFEKILKNIEIDNNVKQNLISFFSDVLTLNDDQILNLFENNMELNEFLNNFYNSKYKIFSKSQLFVIERKTIETYIDDKFKLSKSKKIIDDEIKPFNRIIFNTELKNVNSHMQDEIDDFYYYMNLFETLRGNTLFPDINTQSVLYFTEGNNRKRNKIINVLSNELNDIFIRSENENNLEIVGRNIKTDNNIPDIEECDFDEDKNRRILRNLFVHDQIDEVYNITQIIGLDTVESILVLGVVHVYIVEGYFYDTNGEIVNSDQAPEEQRDDIVKLLNGLSIGNQGNNISSGKIFRIHQSKSWPLKTLVSVSKRKFLLRDVGFELFFRDGSSVLLTCIDNNSRNRIFNKLHSNVTAKLSDENLEEALRLASSQKIRLNKLNDSQSGENMGFRLVDSILMNVSDVSSSNITSKWCNGEISNFQYLMLLNTIAGRTFNDLTQYPIFPFVLSDYRSNEIDLNNPDIYRDLSKPMGAQSSKREQQFKDRYEATREMALDSPPFHYGTHYSSAMIVTSYLIRLHPFTESYLKLQGGKFDHPDRIFHSIPKLWNSASKDNTTDVRELIPEFYYLPQFLTNSNHFKFGNLQDGSEVNHVELPPWANNDPKKFVNIMRDALESPYVSEHLHEWIDLIFGYKQQGLDAIDATNVFHYLSYPGSIDLEKIHDEHEKAVIISIIHNFGQTPLQIFRKKHPPKNEKSYKFNVNIKNIFLTSFKKMEVSVDDKDGVKKRDEKFIEKIQYNEKTKKWFGLPLDLYILPGAETHQLKIQKVGKDSLMINDNYRFEQLTICGCITFISILSSNKFVLGFDTGSLKIYEFSNNKYKYMINAQRSMMNLDYNSSDSQRKKKIFGGFRDNSKSEHILLEVGFLNNGHSDDIIKIKHFKSDGIIVTLDSKRMWLTLWHEPHKLELENGEILQMRQLNIKGGINDNIVDFDICENDSIIFGINGQELVVWDVNIGLIYIDKIGVDRCISVDVCHNLTENDYTEGTLFIVRHKTVEGALKLAICYLSKRYDGVTILQDINLDVDECVDSKMIFSKENGFMVIIGNKRQIVYIK